jgi:hypothetical protein
MAKVHSADMRQTGAQLTLVPASWRQSHDPRAAIWASAKVVRGQTKGKQGATEWQGWYSQSYDDAWPAPVAVYDVQLGANQTRAIFAWLMLPQAPPGVDSRSSGRSSGGASRASHAVITAASDKSVQVEVAVAGQTMVTIIVPMEGA